MFTHKISQYKYSNKIDFSTYIILNVLIQCTLHYRFRYIYVNICLVSV